MYTSGFLFVFLNILSLSYSRKDYTGYKVVDIVVSNEDDVLFLRRLEAKYPEVNEWKVSKHSGDNASFTISPDDVDGFCQEVQENDMSCGIRLQNLQADIEKERSILKKKGRLSRTGFDLFSYNRHPQINAYLEKLVEKCHVKGLQCELITIGQSYEGRDMKVIKIGSGGKKKQGIWIDAGIHAREWVSPSTAIIIANRLIFMYNVDQETKEVIDAFDWYILPSANPDGYEYSWKTDRFWRKTRSPNPGSDCIGTDPNRNWDMHWAEAGTSPDPCTDIYPGPRPFSEVEVVAMVEFIEKQDILLYLSIHAYSQLWITPWSYTDTIQPKNYGRLYRLGDAAARKIRSLYNRRYEVGQVSRILYAASGSSMDWALEAGIKYSLAAELRDTGEYGFLLPVEQVKPVGRETWLGIREMAKLLKQWEID